MSRVKGDKNGTILTVKFNGKGIPKGSLSPNHKTKALILLSIVGNEYCAGEYLQVSAKHATEDYDFTTFLIADQVYWHNLKQSDNPTEADKLALKINALSLGDDYFKANLSAFLAPFNDDTHQKLLTACQGRTVDEQIDLINQEATLQSKNFEIVRWNTWVNRTTEHGYDLQKSKDGLAELYQTEQSLKESIAKTAVDFAKRHQKDGNEMLWLVRSEGYLTEESPSVMWLGADQGYNYVVYPGDMIPPFQATKDFFVVDEQNQELRQRPFAIPVANPNILLNWLQPYFTRKNPQKESSLPYDTGRDKPAVPPETVPQPPDSSKQTGHQVEGTLATKPRRNSVGFFAVPEQKSNPTIGNINDLVDKILALDATVNPQSEAIRKTIKEIAPAIFSLSDSDRTITINLMNTLIATVNGPPLEADQPEKDISSSLDNLTNKIC